MLGRVIIEAAEALNDGGNIALALDLISESLNNRSTSRFFESDRHRSE